MDSITHLFYFNSQNSTRRLCSYITFKLQVNAPSNEVNCVAGGCFLVISTSVFTPASVSLSCVYCCSYKHRKAFYSCCGAVDVCYGRWYLISGKVLFYTEDSFMWTIQQRCIFWEKNVWLLVGLFFFKRFHFEPLQSVLPKGLCMDTSVKGPTRRPFHTVVFHPEPSLEVSVSSFYSLRGFLNFMF